MTKRILCGAVIAVIGAFGGAPAWAAGIYETEILGDNPVGYWRLGEASGATTAGNIGSSGTNNDGTYTNGVTLGATALIHSTKSGGDTAASFDGADDLVNIPADTGDLTSLKSVYTIDLWFNAGDTTSVQYLYEQGGGSNGYVFYLNGNKLTAGLSNNNTFYSVQHSGTVTAGLTHYAAMVYDGGASLLRVYLDGVRTDLTTGLPASVAGHTGIAGIGSISGTGNSGARDHRGIVAQGVDDGHFQGTIDEVATYDAALSSATIRSHFAARLPAPDLGWNADGITNGSLTDWDPNVNTTSSATIDWNGSGTKQSGNTNLGNLTDWVNSPNYILGDVNGSGTGNDSWHDILGNAVTQRDASWEIVFRPGDYTGNHTLFNTGGNGDGTGFVLIGNTLEFRFQDGPSSDQQAFASFDLSTLDAEGDVFFHAVGLADLDNPGNEGTATLWVNGVLRDTDSSDASGGGGIDDWDGGDLAELGTGNNIPGANPFNPDAYDGDIALFNYYDNTLLTQADIEGKYAALVPEPATLAIAAVGLLGLRRRRACRES